MPDVNYTHVTLVLDPNFGQRSKVQAESGPLWVVQSPQNESAIREIRAAGTSRFADAPTVFNAVAGRTSEDSAAQLIGTVDEHHPHWRTFEVVGVKLSPRLLAELRECTPGTAVQTEGGFVFSRE